MTRRLYPPLFPAQTALLHGGDYNPEQWPESVWAEDARLMKVAGVNAVTLGVFSWVSLEPKEGEYTFEWLDEIMDIQARDGRKVALATPTAAVPAWMSRKYPEILRTGADGVRKRQGNRVNTCWSSPIFRAKAAEIGTKLAERYKDHPALGFWHLSNEYSGDCFCELCEKRFREWLKARYGSLDAINAAYWTKFWSHTYTDWEEIEIPGHPHGETSIHGLTVDWKRFSSFQMVDFYRFEAKAVRAVTPEVPCTTNLMGTYDMLNPHELAPDLDFAAWDSYPWFGGDPFDPKGWGRISFMHDLNRSIKGGRPFLLIESTPSASNWYSTMSVKRPGVHQLEGLQAVAHGSDGVEYFQWRQSRGSMEQHHGAVVAHNNREEAKVFQDVASLGKLLGTLSGVIGASVPAEAALIYDWEVNWAIEAGLCYRSKRPAYERTVVEHYQPLLEAQVEVDVVDSTADFSGYKLVIAPMLYMIRPGVAEKLSRFVEEGGTLVTTYLSAWVDENSLSYQGGYPEPLRKLLGIWSEEMDELYPDQTNRVLWEGAEYTATEYCERIHAETAEVLATYGREFYAGQPALTRNRYGKGSAYYVASRNDAAFLTALTARLLEDAGIEPACRVEAPAGVSVRRRLAAEADYFFVLNYTDQPVSVVLDQAELEDAVTGAKVVGAIELPAYGSTVLVARLAPVRS